MISNRNSPIVVDVVDVVNVVNVDVDVDIAVVTVANANANAKGPWLNLFLVSMLMLLVTNMLRLTHSLKNPLFIHFHAHVSTPTPMHA